LRIGHEGWHHCGGTDDGCSLQNAAATDDRGIPF